MAEPFVIPGDMAVSMLLVVCEASEAVIERLNRTLLGVTALGGGLDQGFVCMVPDGSMALGPADPANPMFDPNGPGDTVQTSLRMIGGSVDIFYYNAESAPEVAHMWNATNPGHMHVVVRTIREALLARRALAIEHYKFVTGGRMPPTPLL